MTRATTTLCAPTGTSAAGTLVIERDVFNHVINFATAALPSEVCGFLLVRKLRPDLFKVIDDSLHIPFQESGPGQSETLPQGEIAQMDLEEAYEEDQDVYRLLWHSHGNGTPTFSMTDTGTHAAMAHSTAFDAMFFMVVNAQGQATANIETYQPFRVGTQLRLVVLENTEAPDLDPYKAELARKSRRPAPTVTFQKDTKKPRGTASRKRKLSTPASKSTPTPSIFASQENA